MRRVLPAIAGLLLMSCVAHRRDALELFPDRSGTLVCWTETRSMPRPLRIHYLKAALDGRGLEVFAMPGEDPDGPGPAESELTLPTELVERYHALAAVNANAFAAVGDSRAPGWFEGRPVDILGMMASGRKVISPNENGRTPLWMDASGKPHIGASQTAEAVAEAISDWFSPLLINSKVIPDPADKVLHPRTALGFDDAGAWLLFVVVDGRQPGFSEGVSLHELAGILQAQGCTQSINTDGGGSSILVVRQGNVLRIINSPSDKAPRPVPVMLGVRAKKD